MSLLNSFIENVRKNPTKLAIQAERESYTYEEMSRVIEGIQRDLKEKGYKARDHIAIMIGNEPTFIFSLYAIWAMGATAIPINPNYTKHEIQYILEQSDAKTVLVTQQHQALEAIVCPVEMVGLSSINNCLQDIHIHSMADVAVILYTSGTTGHPKGAMLTHENLFENARDVAEFLGIYHDDRMITVLPVFHVFALTVSVNAPLLQGATLLLQSHFSPVRIFEAANEQGATVMAGVPTMYNFLLHTESSYEKPLGSIRLAISGGSSLPKAVIEQFEERFQLRISEGYGLSEASPVTCFNPLGKQKVGSIGQSIVHVENRIVDEQGLEVPRMKIGELTVRGKNVMKGYYKMSEETANVLKDGWLYTGDLAYMDEEGYVFIVDRKKDLIIVGGYNVYPREVEEVLYQHEAVLEAAVVGLKDVEYGEKVCAYITLKEEIHPERLKVYCEGHLVEYKCPTEIRIVEQLPKNSTGKVLKRQLAEEELR